MIWKLRTKTKFIVLSLGVFSLFLGQQVYAMNPNYNFGALGDVLADPEIRAKYYSWQDQRGEFIVPNQYRDSFIELTKTSGKNVEMYDQLFSLEGHEWNYPERGKESFKLMRKALRKSDASDWGPVMDVWSSRTEEQKTDILNAKGMKPYVIQHLQTRIAGSDQGFIERRIDYILKNMQPPVLIPKDINDRVAHWMLMQRLALYYKGLSPAIALNEAIEKAYRTLYCNQIIESENKSVTWSCKLLTVDTEQSPINK